MFLVALFYVGGRGIGVRMNALPTVCDTFLLLDSTKGDMNAQTFLGIFYDFAIGMSASR